MRNYNFTRKRRRFLLLTVAAVISAEVILRLFFSEKIRFNVQPAIYQADSALYYSYIPDTSFKVGDRTIHINKQGYIDSDFGQKTPDTFRIAFVGSCGVSGAVHKKAYYSFCPMLQQLFRENHLPVRILNCGIDGDNRSMQVFASIKHKVINFDPDLILCEYDLPFRSKPVIRDSYRDCYFEYLVDKSNHTEAGMKMVDKIGSCRGKIDVIYHSYIIRALVYLYKRTSWEEECGRPKSKLIQYIEVYEDHRLRDHRVCPENYTIQYTMEESLRMVNQLKSDLQEKNIAFFLFQYEKDRDLIRFAKENKIPLISLDITFSGKDFFFQDNHMNQYGHQKIADKFYELITKRIIN
jgi:hypothetical protein